MVFVDSRRHSVQNLQVSGYQKLDICILYHVALIWLGFLSVLVRTWVFCVKKIAEVSTFRHAD